MTKENYKNTIAAGEAILGLELGSTRIKAVLIGKDHAPIASGSSEWENRLENGIWTYSLDEVWAGVREAYANLKSDAEKTYGVKLGRLAAMGISGMMHGYLPFDKEGNQLCAFRTWRNTITEKAAAALSDAFSFNIPQRWSIAHLYQAILNGEEHVARIAYLTTVAGYLHWKLTGRFVLGAGEASGMFPLNGEACAYNAACLEIFNAMIALRGFDWTLEDILPAVLPAGADAGCLSAEGAALLDPTGELSPGVPFAPPEGDAGTGMVATNSVTKFTGNVSAGTSIFAMVVLEDALKGYYPEIDVAATPAGKPVAMVHCNSCTSDLNAWVGLLAEFSRAMGLEVDMNSLYTMLFKQALLGDKDCGGLMSYNYYSGEPITETDDGVPMFTRLADAPISLPNFMRTLIYSSMATLKVGMQILAGEQVAIDSVVGHGGLFKTRGVGQSLMAAALGTPVTVMETAGEGGAWGIALLASYMAERNEGETLEQFLADRVFSGMPSETLQPDPADVAGFNTYVKRYLACLDAERACVKGMKG